MAVDDDVDAATREKGRIGEGRAGPAGNEPTMHASFVERCGATGVGRERFAIETNARLNKRIDRACSEEPQARFQRSRKAADAVAEAQPDTVPFEAEPRSDLPSHGAAEGRRAARSVGGNAGNAACGRAMAPHVASRVGPGGSRAGGDEEG